MILLITSTQLLLELEHPLELVVFGGVANYKDILVLRTFPELICLSDGCWSTREDTH
jgi:hypothetical protein